MIRTLIVATVVVGGFGVAGPAFAEPNTGGDSGGMGACPVVNTDDSGKETTTYVPHGAKLAGLTCKDGTWVYVKAIKGAGSAAVTGGQVAAVARR